REKVVEGLTVGQTLPVRVGEGAELCVGEVDVVLLQGVHDVSDLLEPTKLASLARVEELLENGHGLQHSLDGPRTHGRRTDNPSAPRRPGRSLIQAGRGTDRHRVRAAGSRYPGPAGGDAATVPTPPAGGRNRQVTTPPGAATRDRARPGRPRLLRGRRS